MGAVTVEKWNNEYRVGSDSHATTVSYTRLAHKNTSHFYVCPILVYYILLNLSLNSKSLDCFPFFPVINYAVIYIQIMLLLS